MKGTVYLIHFDRAYTTASGRQVWHYLGWALNVEGRLFHHKSGTGARLLRAVNAAGIGYQIVRQWENQDRHFERWLKNRKKSRCFCPVCRGEEPRLSRFFRILFFVFYSTLNSVLLPMKMIETLKIDVVTRTVETVTLPATDGLKTLHELIECQTVSGFYLDGCHYCYVDDEGLLTEERLVLVAGFFASGRRKRGDHRQQPQNRGRCFGEARTLGADTKQHYFSGSGRGRRGAGY